jgi:hypothetical protein
VLNQLLEQGVVRPGKSQYSGPDFLVPKGDGNYRMVVNYRKVNAKIQLYAYPMPSVAQAFDHFSWAVIFSLFSNLRIIKYL